MIEEGFAFISLIIMDVFTNLGYGRGISLVLFLIGVWIYFEKKRNEINYLQKKIWQTHCILIDLSLNKFN